MLIFISIFVNVLTHAGAGSCPFGDPPPAAWPPTRGSAWRPSRVGAPEWAAASCTPPPRTTPAAPARSSAGSAQWPRWGRAGGGSVLEADPVNAHSQEKLFNLRHPLWRIKAKNPQSKKQAHVVPFMSRVLHFHFPFPFSSEWEVSRQFSWYTAQLLCLPQLHVPCAKKSPRLPQARPADSRAMPPTNASTSSSAANVVYGPALRIGKYSFQIGLEKTCIPFKLRRVPCTLT